MNHHIWMISSDNSYIHSIVFVQLLNYAICGLGLCANAIAIEKQGKTEGETVESACKLLRFVFIVLDDIQYGAHTQSFTVTVFVIVMSYHVMFKRKALFWYDVFIGIALTNERKNQPDLVPMILWLLLLLFTWATFLLLISWLHQHPRLNHVNENLTSICTMIGISAPAHLLSAQFFCCFSSLAVFFSLFLSWSNFACQLFSANTNKQAEKMLLHTSKVLYRNKVSQKKFQNSFKTQLENELLPFER